VISDQPARGLAPGGGGGSTPTASSSSELSSELSLLAEFTRWPENMKYCGLYIAPKYYQATFKKIKVEQDVPKTGG
jgi:hypothetical protein